MFVHVFAKFVEELEELEKMDVIEKFIRGICSNFYSIQHCQL